MDKETMYLTDEQALDIAFELFSELASDNLNEQEMTLYNDLFPTSGFIELYDFDPITLEEINLEDPDFTAHIDVQNPNHTILTEEQANGTIAQDENQFVEILIGARPMNDESQILFAKIVLNLNKQDKHSHIQWMSDLL